ncbi:MAG TPA: hypothetical protein VKA61_12130 [Sphingomicrobium sp.]|nr:hypothetical protein [Sphingomicrobium sp.]
MTQPTLPDRDLIQADTPLRLDVAAAIAFPGGGVAAGTLRGAIRSGDLDAELVGNRYFVTLADVDRWRSKCRDRAKERVSGTTQQTGAGTSETDDSSAALAALMASVNAPTKPSPNTSPRDTSRTGGTVIPLTSASPTSSCSTGESEHHTPSDR